MKHIYIVISATLTKFGFVIRKLGGIRYNHAAIAFDPEFNEWYSFARRRHKAVLTGGLMEEHIRRYTLDTDKPVDCIIFRIPVRDEKYDELRDTIRYIADDGEYIYNLLSVLTYPVTKGITTKKAFTCTEFVAYMLYITGFKLKRPICTYKPDEIAHILRTFIYYRGDLAEYVKHGHNKQTDYFDDLSEKDVTESLHNVKGILKRLPWSHQGRHGLQGGVHGQLQNHRLYLRGRIRRKAI